MEKAIIEKVGTVDEYGVCHDWKFNCDGLIGSIYIYNQETYLLEKIAGYTINELRKISSDLKSQC